MNYNVSFSEIKDRIPLPVKFSCVDAHTLRIKIAFTHIDVDVKRIDGPKVYFDSANGDKLIVIAKKVAPKYMNMVEELGNGEYILHLDNNPKVAELAGKFDLKDLSFNEEGAVVEYNIKG